MYGPGTPHVFPVIAEFALITDCSEPLPWPAPVSGRPGGWVAAMAVFAVDLIAYGAWAIPEGGDA